MKKLYLIVRYSSVLIVCFFSFLNLNAQPPTISYQSIISGLTAPVDIVNAHDGTNRLFIVQQGGIIKVWNGTTVSDFINLSSIISTGGERGLLSMAFHPGFNGTSNRYFFVYYTNTSGNVEVSRYQTTLGNSNTGDPSTGTIIITIPHPINANHNGGKLNFGTDGYLYFATGDGGSANDPPNNAQTGTVLLGKMLRIDIDHSGPSGHPNYAIPFDNPYVGSGTIADEVWNLGLRNPFRWSFDRVNGNMWIGDVGQSSQEEIDYRPAGSTGHNNFGWRCYEGYIHTPGIALCTPDPPVNYVQPVFAYPHPTSNAPAIAITGGYVYRGSEYNNFDGYYIAVEFYSGTVFLLWPNGHGGFDSSTQTGLQNYISAFGEGEDGTLYTVSEASNTAYKVVATGGIVLPFFLNSFTVKHFSDYNEVKWTTATEQNTSRFYIEYSTSANNYIRAGQVTASKNANGSSYVFQHHFISTVPTFYRLAIEDNNGIIKYSSVVKISPDADNTLEIYPTIIRNGILNISFTQPAVKLQLISAKGTVVFEKNLKNVSGTITISLPSLGKGMYVAQVIGESGLKRKKVMIE
jgi:glucose/arabinose dehydrogenase